MRLVILLLTTLFFCNCSVIRKVDKSNTKTNTQGDSVLVKKSVENSHSKQDSSTGESGAKSSKNSIQFTIDTSGKKTIINNYLPSPSGNSGIDFLKWLASNNMLKSGSIDAETDSTYQRYSRLLQENSLLKKVNDSLALHTTIQAETDTKNISKTVSWQWWELASLMCFGLLLWEGFRFVKSKFKIVKII